MKIVDISVTISEEIKEPMSTKIEYEGHKEGAKKIGFFVNFGERLILR